MDSEEIKELNAEIQALKVAIKEAVDILDNDLHVSKAQNSRTVLQDALDVHGYPDEDGPDDPG